MNDDATIARRQDAEVEASGGRLLLGWILIAVAAVMLFGGWLGVSATPRVERQMAYVISGGMGGLLAGIAGVGFLLSDDVRRDRERLGRVEASLLELRDLIAAQGEVLSRLDEDRSRRDEASGAESRIRRTAGRKR